MKITKKTKMNEILNIIPDGAEILFEAGMGCIGCSMAMHETLEMGCRAHGMSDGEIDEIIKKINAPSQDKSKALR